MSLGKKIIIGIIVTLLSLVLIVYLAGAYYFSKHFLPGSAINGLDCSFKTVEEVQEVIADEIATYTLTINELDARQEKIVAEAIGMEYVPSERVQQLEDEQNHWLWFLSVSNPKTYNMSAETTYSTEKLKAAVKGLECFKNMIEPQNAYVKEGTNSYTVEPEVEGTALNVNKVGTVIKKAVEAGEVSVDLVAENCYLKPEIYADDENLKKEAEQLTRMTNVVITYDFDDRVETVSKNLIKGWLVKQSDGNYTIDQAKAAEYVHQLAVKYDTFGLSRQFTTSTGNTITVSGGDYGWVINEEKETEALVAAILAGETQDREPIYTYFAYNRQENDIGDSYVEISLAEQRMWFYRNGELLVDTPVVTGNPNQKGNETPPGVYALDNKKSPAVLALEDYSSPVTYWMPFNKNVGIHDATWRTEFGGTLYQTEGSHGCVNTPYDKAEIIYNNIEIGMPIVVY